MYVQTLLDPRAISAASHSTPIARRHIRDAAKRFYGTSIIIAPDPNYQRELITELATLPPDVQAIWVEAIKHNLQRRNAPRLRARFSGVCPNGCAEPELSRPVAVVVSSESPPVDDQCAACGCEYVAVLEYPLTSAVSRAELLQRSALRKGVSRDVEFEERFGLALSAASAITVLDRFAGVGVTRTSSDSPVEWFFEKAVSAGVEDFTLHTTFGGAVNNIASSSADIESSVTAMVKRLRGRTTADIEFRLVIYPDVVMKDAAHDRYVQISISGQPRTVSLGRGLDSFRGNRISQSFQFSLHHDDPVSDFIRTDGSRSTADLML